MWRDGAARVQNIGKIGFARFRERRGHANDHRFAFANTGEIGGRLKFLVANRVTNPLRIDVFDVGPAGIEEVDLSRVNVDSDDIVAAFGESQRQGQPNVAEAYDGDRGGAHESRS